VFGTCFEEGNLKLGFKKGEEGNLNFSCIHSLNLYPSKLKNMFRMINCYNFVFWWRNLNCYDYVNLGIYGINYWNDAIYDWTILGSLNY
jgi:hypothetical protein